MVDNQISRRAKANLPTVLLTLLSIVQALALELMWGHMSDSGYLYTWSFEACLGWLQLLATLLGVILIWLIYSGLVMRFSWVPTTTDAVFPFVIGMIEFAQISALAPSMVEIWFIMTGVIFAAMTWVSQVTMRRARQDSDNDDFFLTVPRATSRDHWISSIPAIGLVLIGVIIWVTNDDGTIAMIAVIGMIALLSWQLRMNHVFTVRSYQRPEPEEK